MLKSTTRMVFCMSFLLSCAASHQGSNSEDLSSADLVNQGEMPDDVQQKEKSDVLELLGIDEQGEGQEPASVQLASKTSEVESLEKDIDELRSDLLDKDREISELRSELTQKEIRITDLESKAQAGVLAVQPVKLSGSVVGPSSDYKSKYEMAMKHYNARSYAESIVEFSELIASNPNTSLSDNCQYWIGEGYYGQFKYQRAISEFEKVFSFPNSNKSDDAQLKLGVCYMKLGEKEQARAEFDRLLAIYPDSEYKELAERFVAKM